MDTLLSSSIQIGGINVLVQLVEVMETDGPHIEVVTTIQSIVEGKVQRWSTAMPFSDYYYSSALEEFNTRVSQFNRMATK